jgi:hypothetical protein
MSKQHRLLTGAEHFAETMVTRADNLKRSQSRSPTAAVERADHAGELRQRRRIDKDHGVVALGSSHH